MKIQSVLVLLLFSLGGCHSNGVKRSDANQFVEVIYGTVTATKKIKYESQAGTAAVGGAVEGVIENSDGNSRDMIGGALIGAAINAIFVSIDEGDSEGLLVDIKSVEGDEMTLSLATRKIKVGDCLKVISGNEISYKKMPRRFCEYVKSKDEQYEEEHSKEEHSEKEQSEEIGSSEK